MQFLNSRSRLKTKFNSLLYCLCAALVLTSCEDPNDLGLEMVEDNVNGVYTDTLTINVSTVLLDSVATSGTGSLLVGQYTTPQTGTQQLSTYFQVGPGGSAPKPAADATFDSLTLYLLPFNYYYGDTTQTVSIAVQELNSTLEQYEFSPVVPVEKPASYFYQSAGIYNTSKVALKEEPLTVFSFAPRPARKDTMEITLSSEVGQQWFNMLKNEDEKMESNANFTEFFKGIGLVPTAGSAVLRFPNSGVAVRLYYSEPSSSGTAVSKTAVFSLANGSLQFNKSVNDFSGSSIDGIKESKELPASATDGISVAQAGAGLMIKLEIPYLEKLKEKLKPEFINKAILVVEPYRGASVSYPYAVPDMASLYETSVPGVLYTPLVTEYDQNATPLASSFIKDSENAAVGRYEFSITEFLIDKLKNDNRVNEPLYLAPATTEFKTGASRLVVAAQDKALKNVRLKVYYTNIQ
ncbi:DUF4270 family protein [Pontibacter mangrovi]|uniref:DUF4270 domain-containing protein n=1 Tax=Pontibacter mangrovi TaxID=2589816 RepID=A0A501WH18_9BACT|nr:DUF4270 family protein [Pontibacter mangrovi]TPE44866.1 DUF4270 domain-containing protein [Pontibacter mangrovi]